MLIGHNLRSCHNVGSLLRTAEGLGVSEVIFSGYTPYPKMPDDPRLPHLAEKNTQQIHKTALGAETTQNWRRFEDIFSLFHELRQKDFFIAALEQAPHSVPLSEFHPPSKLALIVGREVEGIEPEILLETDSIIEIPMAGRKESFNVCQAAAMALYHCQISDKT